MPSGQASRARAVGAWIIVILTVVAVWTFTDYRNQPPPVSSVAAPR